MKSVVTDDHIHMAVDSKDEVAIISLYQDGNSSLYQPQNQSGKPQAMNVTHEDIELSWAKPTHDQDIVL